MRSQGGVRRGGLALGYFPSLPPEDRGCRHAGFIIENGARLGEIHLEAMLKSATDYYLEVFARNGQTCERRQQ
jgi:hypothetical protein